MHGRIIMEALAGDPPNATAILEDLKGDRPFWQQITREAAAKGWPAPALPSLRTVQAIVREYRPPDSSARWSVGDAEGDDEARLVLPVLAEIADRTKGHSSRVTHAEAEWVVRIRRAVPTLAPWQAFQLARFYLAKTARNESTETLDLYLALTVWPSARIELAPVMLENADGAAWFGIAGSGTGDRVDDWRPTAPIEEERHD